MDSSYQPSLHSKVSLSQHIPWRLRGVECAISSQGRLGLGIAISERGSDFVQCEKLGDSQRGPELAHGNLMTDNLLDKGHG